MDNQLNRAGNILRAIRKRRGMTLAQAAPLLSMSVSALSRRERGLERIQRSEVKLAIAAYKLDIWEERELWRASGYLPSAPANNGEEINWRASAESVLRDIHYPAWFLSNTGHITAWNACMNTLWHLDRQPHASAPHVFDVVIFSERSKSLLREAWRDAVLRLISYNYHSTLGMVDNPDFEELLDVYRRQHGEEFEQLFAAALDVDMQLSDNDIEQSIGTFHTRAGPIRFMYMQSAFPYPVRQGLYVFLPLGQESRSNYRRLSQDIQPRVYFA